MVPSAPRCPTIVVADPWWSAATVVLYNGTSSGAPSLELVIDASAVLAVLLEEPERPALIAATTGRRLLAPPSLPWEIGNALVAMVRRSRLGPELAATAWEAWQEVPVRLVDVDVKAAMDLAFTHGLYAYDAYLLALAQARRAPLLTLDKSLVRAAKAAGIPCEEI